MLILPDGLVVEHEACADGRPRDGSNAFRLLHDERHQ